MVIDTPLTSFEDGAPERKEFLSDVLIGLIGRPKSLPCKYFYDERGSDLFRQICELPEYYPTRIETALLMDCADAISAAIGPRCRLIEYGTGSSEKMRILLDALELPSAFISVDISREHLLQTTSALARDYPEVEVHAVCADFTKSFVVPHSTKTLVGKTIAFFPGSSLGNFHRREAIEFLMNVANVVGQNGGLVIGIDLKKDVNILNAAYRDSAGVTAAFNLNLLVRINNELGGTFDVDTFKHHAFYNEEKGRIEMHIVSLKEQKVSIGDKEIHFRDGETIHTENSYKYDIDEFQDLASEAGFISAQVWRDPNHLFSVHYFETAN
jgi:dimethylhistidine N-methyltransferase